MNLEKARILLLRITVPADLYQSGILIEIEGVEIQLRAESMEKEKKETAARNTKKAKHSKAVKADRNRSTQSLVHDPGGLSPRPASDFDEEDEEQSDTIPTTIDLAQSFLQAELPDEKAELQASVARSHNLEQSQTSSDSRGEVASLGVGDGLSLPGFLADFLKGVGDRVQLRVQNVEVDVVLNLTLPTEGLSSSGGLNRSETITVRLSIEELNIDGVTTNCSISSNIKSREDVNPAPSSAPYTSRNKGTRRISLRNVHGMLLSDTSVFANMSRSGVPVSPAATQTSVFGKSNHREELHTSHSSRSRVNSGTEYRVLSEKGAEYMECSPLEASMASSDGERLNDAGCEDDSERTIAPNGQGYDEPAYDQDGVLTESFYLDVDGNHFGHENIMDSEVLPPSLRYKQVSHSMSSLAASQERVETQRSHLSATSRAHDQALLPQSSRYNRSEDCQVANSAERKEPEYPAHGQDLISCPEEVGPESTEDLTQSKIFSHEEAESMYMSAISHASSQGIDRSKPIPGGWNESSSDDDQKDVGPRVPPNAPSHDRAATSQRWGSVGKQEAQQYPTVQYNEPCVTSKQSSTPIASLASLEAAFAVQPQAALNQTPDYASSQKSEVSSSKSENPLIILKRFISVSSIVLELGHEQSNAATEFANLATSTRRSQDPPAGLQISLPPIPMFGNKEIYERFLQATSIEVGKVELLGDVGLTRLTVLIMQHIMEVLGSAATKERDAVVSKPDPKLVKLKVQNIRWKFVDLVQGFTLAGSRAFLAEVATTPIATGAEILLEADAEDLDFIYRVGGSSTNSKLSLRKLSFGYDSGDILSFDSTLKMRESTRDALAPTDNDVVLLFTNVRGMSKIECTTLPLHISLDLRRLDETFGWFGGFSCMLGLGSSMMSTVTVVDKPQSAQPARLHKGVHFETSGKIRTQENQSSSKKKLTARLGGIVIDLHGSSSSVRLESTALKLVSRAEGVGVQLDKVHLSGPYMRIANEIPSISIKLGNIRLEYLSTPKEVDLARLLSLLSPSKDKYEQDDDILLDTLLRQRRQGGVVRATIESFDCRASDLHDLETFPTLVEELKKLSTVTKYLPEDDRPGILTLGLIRDFQIEVFVNSSFGTTVCNMKNVEAAHVTLPSLTTLGIKRVQVYRNRSEELLGEALAMDFGHDPPAPMIMGRFVGNEMEPTVKIKLHNIRIEYHISTVMAIMGLSDATTAETIVADIASSVVTITNQPEFRASPAKPLSQTSNDRPTGSSKTLKLNITIRDSLIGLNPRNSTARGLVVLTNTQFVGALPREDEANATLEIRTSSLMIIDDVHNVLSSKEPSEERSPDGQYSQIGDLADRGYVSVGYISAAKATMHLARAESGDQSIDIEVQDDLLVLESCADSTQTLQSIMNGLKPPLPPSTELKYRTEVVPVQDMLASLSGNAFAAGENNDGTGDYQPLGFEEGDMVDDEVPQNLEFVSSFYNPDPDRSYDGIAESMLEEDLESIAGPPRTQKIGDKRLLESFQERFQVAPGGAPLEFREDHFGINSTVGGRAHRWDTKQNTYRLTNDFKITGSPLRVRVRDVHLIWNLFDGYDWQHTRDVISQAVADVQSKAAERRSKADRRKSFEVEEEEQSVIGDFLFNSIYIGIPANRDPRELSRQVNRNLDDLVSESESYATSSASGSPSRQAHKSHIRGRRLRLSRSKYHKMTFELKGVSADLVVFPPGMDETQSSLDIRVQDLEVFDHVPRSTWKKFATYMHDAGERESGTSMVHLEILTVKPVPTLAASEIILKVSS